MEKALPGQVSTSSGEEPRQLPLDPMPLLLPITTPEVLFRIFCCFIQDNCWAPAREGREDPNRVPEDWEACLFSFPAHRRSGISLKEKKCSLHFINYTPDPRPQTKQNKTSSALCANGEAWKLQKPRLQFSGPRRGDGVHFCHLSLWKCMVWSP